MTNHMSYLVAAQLGPGRADEVKRTTDALVSLFSVCNAFGRLGAGLGSDKLQARARRADCDQRRHWH